MVLVPEGQPCPREKAQGSDSFPNKSVKSLGKWSCVASWPIVAKVVAAKINQGDRQVQVTVAKGGTKLGTCTIKASCVFEVTVDILSESTYIHTVRTL